MALTRSRLFAGALPSLVVIAVAACARQVAPAPTPTVTPLVIGTSSAAAVSVSADAPPQPSASSTPPPARDTSAPCPSECHGSQPTRELIDAVSSRAKDSRRCYNAALAKTPALHGRVSVHLVIAGDGHVCTAEATSLGKDPGMVPVAECVAGVFLASSLPPIGESCADLLLPIVFVARGNDAGP